MLKGLMAPLFEVKIHRNVSKILIRKVELISSSLADPKTVTHVFNELIFLNHPPKPLHLPFSLTENSNEIANILVMSNKYDWSFTATLLYPPPVGVPVEHIFQTLSPNEGNGTLVQIIVIINSQRYNRLACIRPERWS